MIKSLFFTIFFFTFITFNNSFSQNKIDYSKLNYILNKDYKTQYLVVDSIKEYLNRQNSVNIVAELQNLEKWATLKNDLQLKYIVRLSKLKKIYNNLNDSSLVKKIQYVINQSNSKELLPLKAQGLEFLADYYWAKKNYSSALENSLNSYNIYEKYSINTFPQKAEYLYNIVSKYYYFRDFDNAKKYCLQVWNTIPIEKIDNPVSKLNTLGLCYFHLNKIDSSNYYLLKALDYSYKNNLELWVGITSGNLGSNYLKENKTKEAIFYFEKCIEIEIKNNQKLDLAINLSKYGAALLLENRVKEALDAQLKSIDLLNKYGYVDFKITYLIFPNVAKAFAANGNYNKAYKYLDSAFIAKTNYENERNAVFFSGFQHKIDVERHKTEIKKNEDEIKNQKFLRNLMVIGFLILFLISIVFYFQQRKFRKTQLKLFITEKLAVLGQVSAGVAHEVNTPLSAIKSSSEESSNSFPEIIDDFLWITNNLNKSEIVLLFDFIKLSKHTSKTLTTKEEREIKKNLSLVFSELGIQNSRYISEKFIQVGIYNVNEQFVELSKLPNFEKLILFACNLLNQQKSHQTIQLAVNKASRIVIALKTYLHTSDSENMELINIKDNLETVLTIYQNRLKQGVKVIKNYDDVPDIYGYPDQLNQVWTNLIVNAVQAMDNKGILTLTLKMENNFIILSIKDTGKGIPKKIQSKIFDPFFTTKASGEGSGIGLDITRRILKEHSATISFDSIENEGTTFYVKIPIAKSI